MIADHRRSTRLSLALLVAMLAIAGCVAAGGTPGPSSSPVGGRSVPGSSAAPAPSGGGGGGSVPGDPGAPIATLPTGDPGSIVPDPTGTLVTPQPGVVDPHPVNVQRLVASLDGGHVIVRLDWVSGVPPCSALARVDVARAGSTFTLTVLEGPTKLGVACIEIAMYKATLVDLGALPAGTYVVRAVPGDAPAVTVVVP